MSLLSLRHQRMPRQPDVGRARMMSLSIAMTMLERFQRDWNEKAVLKTL
jgi:hypothetical protein